MNKLIAAPAAALILSGGLVATVGATAANAAPYPGTVKTTTVASGPSTVQRGASASFCGKVTASGSKVPKGGTITITVTRDNGGFSDSVTKTYGGSKTCAKFGPFNKRNGYTVKVTYKPADGSVYKKSSDSTTFRVVKRGA